MKPNIRIPDTEDSGPVIPQGAACFTNRLAGATLDELLENAGRNWWPEHSLEVEWELLRCHAFQAECLLIDKAENRAWERQMLELFHRNLPYEEYVEARMSALEARLRARKLA
ncbi:hypothetical protein GCM10022239_10230 [Leifsonia bigeumensis]|uniref:Phage protein n=1 Tax=Leifsonella bigeumensis TaxID=433643 RepID=A0ABP7FHY4_9MICO